MPGLHKEILTKEQEKILPLARSFSKDFFLVGGTAIALHIGHRRSVDFDLFSTEAFNNADIRRKILQTQRIQRVLVDKTGEFTLTVRGVRMTIFHYPFRAVRPRIALDGVIKIPDLLTLSAMKAYALGRRAKWKDYVDMFFVMRDHHALREIAEKARKIFGREFNEKIFRAQLAYFRDIDYSEKVIFMKGCAVPDNHIKKGLIDFSLS